MSCIHPISAKIVVNLQDKECSGHVYEYFSSKPNPPTIEQSLDYCVCLFSYDDESEEPVTLDNITEEHIENCKSTYLGGKL